MFSAIAKLQGSVLPLVFVPYLPTQHFIPARCMTKSPTFGISLTKLLCVCLSATARWHPFTLSSEFLVITTAKVRSDAEDSSTSHTVCHCRHILPLSFKNVVFKQG